MFLFWILICLYSLYVFVQRNDNYLFSLYFNEYWFRSFDFTGKTKRKDFWFSYLDAFIIYFVFILIIVLTYDWYEDISRAGPPLGTTFLSGFLVLLLIVSFFPNLAIQVRRLNDIGKDPAWVLLSFIPFVSIVLIFWYFKPSLSYRSSILKEIKENSSYQENIFNEIMGEMSEDLKNNFESAEEKLKKITSMFERGVITEEEFKELRKKTLGLN